jgi:hypothetical protein
MINVITNALAGGVGYQVARPSISLLRSIIRQNVPLLVTVTSAALYRWRGDVFAGHTVVVNGADRGLFWFVDPMDGQQREIEEEDLLFAILSRKLIADDAYMLEVQRQGGLLTRPRAGLASRAASQLRLDRRNLFRRLRWGLGGIEAMQLRENAIT